MKITSPPSSPLLAREKLSATPPPSTSAVDMAPPTSATSPSSSTIESTHVSTMTQALETLHARAQNIVQQQIVEQAIHDIRTLSGENCPYVSSATPELLAQSAVLKWPGEEVVRLAVIYNDNDSRHVDRNKTRLYQAESTHPPFRMRPILLINTAKAHYDLAMHVHGHAANAQGESICTRTLKCTRTPRSNKNNSFYCAVLGVVYHRHPSSINPQEIQQLRSQLAGWLEKHRHDPQCIEILTRHFKNASMPTIPGTQAINEPMLTIPDMQAMPDVNAPDHTERLPDPVFRQILSALPPIDLLNCERVSKVWKARINGLGIWQTQLQSDTNQPYQAQKNHIKIFLSLKRRHVVMSALYT